MEGWRAKIGIIVPAANAAMEPDFNRLARNGIAVFASRIGRTSPTLSVESLLEMLEHLDDAARLLARAGVDLMVYGCTSGSFVGGVGSDQQISNRITELTGVPAITTSTAVLAALKRLDIRRVSIFTPYPDDVNAKEDEFFANSGFEVTGVEGMGLNNGAQIRAVPTEEVYRLAKAAFVPDSDGLFISCTTFRALGAISLLERDLGKPVVTSNQASYWYALQKLGIREPIDGYGQLLSQ